MSFINRAKSIILGPDFVDENEFSLDDEPIYEEEMEEEVKPNKKNYSTSNSNSKVVNLHQTPKMEVVRTYPETVADSFPICDYVRENKVCIVNLEGVDPKEAQRIADFLGGVAYAFNGDIQRISKGVFIIAPTSVEISGQLKDELKETGVIFPWVSSAFK